MEFKDLEIYDLINRSELVNNTSKEKLESFTFKGDLNVPFLGAFRSVVFEVATNNNQYVLDELNNPKIIRIKFSESSTSLNEGMMQNVVNSSMKLLNISDNFWTNTDYMRVLSGSWRGRVNLENNLFIILEEDGSFTLEIIDLNELLKLN